MTIMYCYFLIFLSFVYACRLYIINRSSNELLYNYKVENNLIVENKLEEKININLLKCGFFTLKDQKKFKNFLLSLYLIIPFIAFVFCFFLGFDLILSLLFSCQGIVVAYFLTKTIPDIVKSNFLFEITYSLPLFIERLSIALASGETILSAVLGVVNLEKEICIKNKVKLKPLFVIFDKVISLVENGLPFDEALNEIAKQTDSTPLKHAFLFLGNTYRDGGEVQSTLRDLAEDCIRDYDDEVSNYIATLPGKAMLPLAITLGGFLINIFVPTLYRIFNLLESM